MKFLVDECLSYAYVRRLADRGYPDAIHPLHVGLRAARDDRILARALADDRIIVTADSVDYLKLLAREELHPGAIIVPALELEPTWVLISIALAFIEFHPKPADFMVDRVIEVSALEGIVAHQLPAAAGGAGAIR